ncbi:MAG: hypothetical protein ABJA37_12620 [Ferruginibacter sp.]
MAKSKKKERRMGTVMILIRKIITDKEESFLGPGLIPLGIIVASPSCTSCFYLAVGEAVFVSRKYAKKQRKAFQYSEDTKHNKCFASLHETLR